MDKILEFVTDRDSDDDIDLGESDYEGSDSDFDLYDEDEDVPEPQFVPDDIPHPVAEYVVGEEEDEVDTEDLPVSRSNDISDDDEPLAKLAKGCASEQSTSDDTTDDKSGNVNNGNGCSADTADQHSNDKDQEEGVSRVDHGHHRTGPRFLTCGAVARVHNMLDARGRPGLRIRGGRGFRARGGRGSRTRGGRGLRTRGVRGLRTRGGLGGGRLPAAGRMRNPLSNWEKINSGEHQNLKDFVFAEREGIIPRLGNQATCLDFLNLYFTDEVWNLLVTETNRFADQFFQSNAASTYTSEWVAVTVDEMKAFIGVIMLMGIVYKPNIHMYWSTDILYNTPIFSQVMTRDRFYLILKFLHFNNNEDPEYDKNDENRDRLHKLRPLIDIFRRQCRSVYQPGMNLSVDESLVLFKGRLKFKQYIKTKRARFGMKLYELCTSNGITLDFLIYCGKGMFHQDDPHADMPSTERIPAVLMESFLGKGYSLFTDNYYTSPTLAKFFLENRTHLTGTVRTNRYDFPKNLVAEQLEKGTAAFYTNRDTPMIACKYRASKDKANGKEKLVYMLTTTHQPEMIEVPEKGAKPGAVRAYNIHMGGVDRVDQQLHGFKILRKAYKWYKKLAFRLMMQMTLNAHKVFVHKTGSEKSLQDFVHDIICILLSSSTHQQIRQPIPDDNYVRLTGRHFISVKEAAPGASNQRPTKRCKVCYARGISNKNGNAARTIYVCKSCPSEPGLHPHPCFEVYHTVLNYSDVE